MHTNTHSHKQAQTDTNTRTRAHAHTHTHTHKHTHAHAHARTHTHFCEGAICSSDRTHVLKSFLSYPSSSSLPPLLSPLLPSFPPPPHTSLPLLSSLVSWIPLLLSSHPLASRQKMRGRHNWYLFIFY